MNTILLQPTDVLFFRDGRPIGGASAGHGAAWPLPSVINHALHAALHRAGGVFDQAHPHRRGRSGIYTADADRRFGSLVTAGPFPVCVKDVSQTWFFPRPADADDTCAVFLHPNRTDAPSSLPAPCKYPVVSSKPPTKERPKPWWSESAWSAYLGRKEGAPVLRADTDFADTEHNYGIGLNPDTGTVQEGQFYSASYLRLRDEWRLGVIAAAPDKDYRHAEHGNDLIRSLLNGHGREIIVGGQQRVCTATLEHLSTGLPLPLGLGEAKQLTRPGGGFRVKWVLLSPAVWPEVPAGLSKRGTTRKFHPGGWLPNWICPSSGDILLETIAPEERRRRRSLNYGGKGYESKPARNARLVAALVPKPLAVTGWALANDTDRSEGGAKATHFAVPAGAVYYFEADSEDAAVTLANALNWHGSDTNPTTIRNRRSTLLGEKGFGLGVCGTWDFLQDVRGRPKS